MQNSTTIINLAAEKKLFIFSAPSPQALVVQLAQVSKKINSAYALNVLMQKNLTDYAKQPLSYNCVIVARGVTDFHKEAQRMATGIPKAMATNKAWKTPSGSYFTPSPLAKQGKVTFVYPGMGSAYPGLAEKIVQIFPGILESFNHVVQGRAAEFMQEQRVNASSTHAAKAQAYATAEEQLNQDIDKLFIAGMSFSWVFTYLLRHILVIAPDFAFGHSIGEVSMLTALDIYQNPLHLYKNTQQAAYYQEMTGSMAYARQYWQRQGCPVPEDTHAIWRSYIIQDPPLNVQAVLARFERVYLMAIHSGKECMIGGYPPECEKLLALLDSDIIPLPYHLAFHAPVMSHHMGQITATYNLPLSVDADKANHQLYSAANYTPVAMDPLSIAKAVAQTHCQTIEFPRLVNAVYNNGARIFIEVGGRNNCSYWIEHILAGQPHIAIPLNTKGVDDWHGLLKALAMLISHGVKPDLACLSVFATGTDKQNSDMPVTTTEYVAPRNNTEKQLVESWAQVLNPAPGEIGVNDDFFDLGGHSLLAVQLIAKINTQFKQSLPLTIFFTESSVVTLAQVILSGKTTSFDILVPIQTHGNKIPIFAMPGIGGNVASLQPLSRALGDKQPFYALQAIGLDGKTSPLDSVEKTAKANIAAIQAIQTTGSYRLIGHSYGGVVAYEMARILLAQGERIASLILLDSLAPSVMQAQTTSDEVTLFYEVCTRLAILYGVNLNLDIQQLQQVSENKRNEYMANTLNRHGIDITTEQLTLFYKVFKANERCYRRYRPSKLSHKIAVSLYRAGKNHQAMPAMPDDYGWDPVLLNEISHYDVDADHFSMLNKEQVDQLASKMVFKS
ncbi:MAG: PfaB family protein [Proteobacteria bacterium]|nr:PfaB family protein [Pseudomonadota bacterium]